MRSEQQGQRAVVPEARFVVAASKWRNDTLGDVERDDTLVDTERLVCERHCGVHRGLWMVCAKQIVRLIILDTKHELITNRDKLGVHHPRDKLINPWLARDHVETLRVRLSLRSRPGAAMVGANNK